eukprot:TRINITY_DN3342_c0_g1_i3.p2 TRINITY_DN3342_c0_g1~~TRINITY_DN3342_c0_g1_i3.p2  ORF type:complete len:107 (+),score=9.43 TRINITY_DN3342_c0_g1_i3:591-911(+)
MLCFAPKNLNERVLLHFDEQNQRIECTEYNNCCPYGGFFGWRSLRCHYKDLDIEMDDGNSWSSLTFVFPSGGRISPRVATRTLPRQFIKGWSEFLRMRHITPVNLV